MERKAGENTEKYSIFDYENPLKSRISGGRNDQAALKFRVSPVMSLCGARNFRLAVRFAKFRPRQLLIARFICHRQRSQTSPLRYVSVYYERRWCLSFKRKILYQKYMTLSMLGAERRGGVLVRFWAINGQKLPFYILKTIAWCDKIQFAVL